MIGYLRGYIINKTHDHVIIDVNNVGYEVYMPTNQMMNLPLTHYPAKDTYVELYIYTHVKEDSLELFGFTNAKDKELFKILIGISGIGPKLGLTILNNIDISTLLDAIKMDNSKILTTVPGIGNKTAERLLLELKGKQSIKKLSMEYKLTTTKTTKESSLNFDDAINALQSLGYKDSDAIKAVKSVISDDLPLQKVIKLALKELA